MKEIFEASTIEEQEKMIIFFISGFMKAEDKHTLYTFIESINFLPVDAPHKMLVRVAEDFGFKFKWATK